MELDRRCPIQYKGIFLGDWTPVNGSIVVESSYRPDKRPNQAALQPANTNVSL